MKPIVRVGVGVFVWKDGKFLMGQRRGSHGQNTWSLPGGHLEFNETWAQCAVREVREETGLAIKNVRFLAVTNDVFKAEAKHYVTIWIEGDWSSGNPAIMEPDKLINLQWRSFDNLPKPLFLSWKQLRKIVPHLFT
ncbi:MAG TPA: NUDIX hydrolase [Candidatus Limnocylindrales bacterium]|nr:NUDIX hydrolase [Candidatus Limnocylindrales bacterium]